MGPQEGRHLLFGRGHRVHPAAEAQRHDEEIDLHPPAADDRPALAPVGLALAPRRRLEPDRGPDIRLLPQRADKAFDDIVAALISANPKLLVDRLGTVGHRRQPLQDVIPLQAQKTALLSRPRIDLGLLLAKNLPDRFDVKLYGAGDRLLRPPSLWRLWISCYRSPLTMSSPLGVIAGRKCTLLMLMGVPPSRGGFLNAHKGGLLHARW